MIKTFQSWSNRYFSQSLTKKTVYSLSWKDKLIVVHYNQCPLLDLPFLCLPKILKVHYKGFQMIYHLFLYYLNFLSFGVKSMYAPLSEWGHTNRFATLCMKKTKMLATLISYSCLSPCISHEHTTQPYLWSIWNLRSGHWVVPKGLVILYINAKQCQLSMSFLAEIAKVSNLLQSARYLTSVFCRFLQFSHDTKTHNTSFYHEYFLKKLKKSTKNKGQK